MNKAVKAEFNGGSVTLHCGTSAVLNEANESEICGRVELKLRQNAFIRGVWVKLVGKNVITCPEKSKDLYSYNLLQYEEYFHVDGIQEVFIGFAEGDEDNGSLLELSAGKHKWPFHFKLPKYSPATYCDQHVTISYVVSAIMDSPVVPLTASTATQTVLIESIPDADCRLMLENSCHNVMAPSKTFASKSSGAESSMVGRFVNYLRPPTFITMQGLGAPAIFPFKGTALNTYSVKCRLGNIHTKQRVFILAQLYVEVATRESIANSFMEEEDSNLIPTESHFSDNINSIEGKVTRYAAKSGDLNQKHLVWGKSFTLNSERENKTIGELTMKIPIQIDSKTQGRNLRTWPAPLPLSFDSGDITSCTTEGPLFRYRVLLKLSAYKGTSGSNKLLCNPVYGEVMITPPSHTEMGLTAPSPTSTTTSSSTAAASIASTSRTAATASVTVPPMDLDPPLTSRSVNSSLASQMGSVGYRTDSVPTTARSRTDSYSSSSSVREPLTAAGGSWVAPVNELSLPSTVSTPQRNGSRSRRNSRENNIVPAATTTTATAASVNPTGARVRTNSAIMNQHMAAGALTSHSIDQAISTILNSSGNLNQLSSRPPLATSSNNANANSNPDAVRRFTSPVVSSTAPVVDVVVVPTAAAAAAGVDANKENGAAGANKPKSKKVNGGKLTNTSNNANKVITPHAKPTNFAIKVEAELLSRGPAAAVHDRNAPNYNGGPITTPQRYAPIFRLGEAVVIPGTPINNLVTPNVVSIFNQTAGGSLVTDDDFAAQFQTPRMDGMVYALAVASAQASPILDSVENTPRGAAVDLHPVRQGRLFA